MEVKKADFLKRKVETIYCIGDSHANVFSGRNRMGPKWPELGENKIPLFKSYRLGPVLAYSFCELGTQTQGREKLFCLVKEIPLGSTVMLCFGEIDCRVHLIRQAEIQKKGLEEIVNGCVDRYFSVILELKKMGYRMLIWHVCPSTKYNVKKGEYATYGSSLERNKAIKLFNERLSYLAGLHSLPVISIFNDLIGGNLYAKIKYYNDAIHLSSNVLPFVIREIEKNIPYIDKKVLGESKKIILSKGLCICHPKRLLKLLLLELGLS